MNYYISDLHFGHARLNEKIDCRGFESTEQMDEYMIAQWNSRVKDGDHVFILGDLSVSSQVGGESDFSSSEGQENTVNRKS